MFKSNFWKLLISVVIAAWAVAELLPLRDIPFVTYARTHATARSAEFNALVDEAAARKQAGKAPSEYVALEQIGKERRIDYSQFFPDFRLDPSITNIAKRDGLVLKELLDRSKGRLQLGLDLRGGVRVTFQVDEKAVAKVPENQRSEKLNKAVEIIATRINSLGVTEPIVRAVGNNRIEVEMPGISTKDNPDIIDQIGKPARLDFRLVHPTLTPSMVPPGEVPPGYQLMTLEEPNREGAESTEELFVKRIPEMTGTMISNAFASQDSYARPEVSLRLTHDGQKRFAPGHQRIVAAAQQSGRPGRLAIVLDGKLYSAPR